MDNNNSNNWLSTLKAIYADTGEYEENNSNNETETSEPTENQDWGIGEPFINSVADMVLNFEQDRQPVAPKNDRPLKKRRADTFQDNMLSNHSVANFFNQPSSSSSYGYTSTNQGQSSSTSPLLFPTATRVSSSPSSTHPIFKPPVFKEPLVIDLSQDHLNNMARPPRSSSWRYRSSGLLASTHTQTVSNSIPSTSTQASETIVIDDDNVSPRDNDVQILEVMRKRRKTTSSTSVDTQTSSRKEFRPVINGEDELEHQRTLNANVLQVVECPVCWEYMQPPIHQCKRGHLLCHICKNRINICPTCRTPMSRLRNLAMEHVTRLILYPCSYSNEGCQKMILIKDRSKHENNCVHRTYHCVVSFCLWTGKKSSLTDHIATSHRHVIKMGPVQDLSVDKNMFSIPNYTCTWIVCAFDEVFKVYFMLKNHCGISMCVRYIGPTNDANKFVYEFSLGNDKNKCVIKFGRITHPNTLKASFLSSIGDCFFVRYDTAMIFSDESRLKVRLNITPTTLKEESDQEKPEIKDEPETEQSPQTFATNLSVGNNNQTGELDIKEETEGN